jgi:hypothetical protein
MACFSKIGVLVNDGNLTTPQRISVSQQYFVKYSRNLIVLNEWPYTPTEYNQYVAAGFQSVLNLNWGRQSLGAIPFPTNMTLYASQITSVLDTITKPELIVIENEELNSNYHSGAITQYFTMLATAQPIVHSYGLLMTNGGIYGLGLYILTYRYLVSTYGQSTADAFGNNCMRPNAVLAAKNPNSNPTIEAYATLMQQTIDGEKNYIDIWNIHPYEDLNPNDTPDEVLSKTAFTPYVIQRVQEYLAATTGLPVMTNETGVRTNIQADLVTSMINNDIDLQLQYIIYFDGYGAGADAQPLHNLGTTTLRTTGDAFAAVNLSVAATSGVYILGDDDSSICSNSPETLYTAGTFGIGKIIYSDSDLCTAVTGSSFIINTADNCIYTIDSATGEILADTEMQCTGAIAGTYKLGNDATTICNEDDATLYTSGTFMVGSILYNDAGLSVPQTGYDFLVRSVNGKIYNLNSATGEIEGLQGGVCNGGIIATVQYGNDILTICTEATTSVYTRNSFALGQILYTDINLTIHFAAYDFVADENDFIYSVDNATGELLSIVGLCNSGVAGDYKVGNDISTVCDEAETIYYTDGSLALGNPVYTDINLTIPLTGYNFLVDTATDHIYTLNSDTGIVESMLQFDCSQKEFIQEAIEAIPHTANFINSNNAQEYNRIIQMVVIDARVKEKLQGKNGFIINARVREISSNVSSTVAFYKIESINGSVAGFFLLNTDTGEKVYQLLRPNVEVEKAVINRQISAFIISGTYKQEIL